MLTADDFLRPPVRRIQLVSLPVRGGQAAVRSLLAMEGVRLADALRAAEGEPLRLAAAQLAAFLCDQAGQALLTLEQAIDAVEKMEAPDLKALLEAGGRLNSLTDESVEEASKN